MTDVLGTIGSLNGKRWKGRHKSW